VWRPLVIALLVVGCSREDPARSVPAAQPGAIRLVSLTPSATELVLALDAGALLVGVDEYSAQQPAVAQLPKVGSFLKPDVETIIKLAPTLVIVDDVHGPAAATLHDAHIATLECPMHDLPDVRRGLRAIGARIDRSAQADRVIAAIDAAIDAARRARPATPPRVLAVIDREASGLGNLVAAGPGSWVDELLAILGADNVLAAAGTRYPKISIEEVLRARPEIILDLSYAAREGIGPWATIDTTKRVKALTDQSLLAPSPRVGEALSTLAAALR
jgi:cobalamin transport system substrate-binding protein